MRPVLAIAIGLLSGVVGVILIWPRGGEGAARVPSARTAAEREVKRADADPAPEPPPDEPEPGGLRVRVVDSQGKPVAGVPVALEIRVPGMGWDARGWATSRSPDGLARLDLGEYAEQRRGIEAARLEAEYSVVTRLAAPSPVRVALARWPSDGDEVELVVPALGSVVVRVVEADGKGVAGDVTVAWWWLPADVAASQPNAAYDRVANHITKAPGGVARIDGVGLGLALTVQATVPGRVRASERGWLGPTAPGEVKDLTLVIGPPLGAVTLRVLEPGGEPLAGASLWATQYDEPERERHPAAGPYRGSLSTVRTDEAGLARLPYAPGEVAFERRLDIERRGPDGPRQDDPDWALGSIWLPRRIESGATVHLGDVWLTPARVLVAGRVVDEDGAPIAGADLRFRERFGSTPDHGWYNLADGWIRAGPDGAFELRGVSVPRELGVMVHAPGFEALSQDRLAIGGELLVVTLERSLAPRGGSMRLKVVLDDGVPFMRCLLNIRRRGRGGGGRSPDWIAGAPMAVDRLAPGTYDVSVETRDGGFELGRVEGVVVEAGMETRDPRLLPFNLRGTARLVEIRVVRPDKAPWRRQDVTLQAPGVGRAFNLKTDDEGLAAFVLPLGVTTLDVSLDGDHRARIAVGAADEPVRIEFAP